jgi:hypothetical protein
MWTDRRRCTAAVETGHATVVRLVAENGAKLEAQNGNREMACAAFMADRYSIFTIR